MICPLPTAKPDTTSFILPVCTQWFENGTKGGGGGREKKSWIIFKWVGFTLSEEIGFPDRLSSWMWMLVLSEWPGHRHIEICYTPALHTWRLWPSAQCTKHNQKETPWKVIRGRLNGQWALMPSATEMHLTDVHIHTVIPPYTHTEVSLSIYLPIFSILFSAKFSSLRLTKFVRFWITREKERQT